MSGTNDQDSGRDSEARLRGEFVTEAQEVIEALSRALLDADAVLKEGDRPSPDTVNEAFRATHTLKGLSSLFGQQQVADLAHKLEDVLDGVRLGRLELDETVLDVLFDAVDLLGVQVVEGEALDLLQVEAFDRRLARLVAPTPAPLDLGAALQRLRVNPELLSTLTEYEEHRLQENVEQGRQLFLVHGEFDVSTIDAELEELRARLKSLGEVITCLPSDDEAAEDHIGLDLMLASGVAPDQVETVAQSLGARAEALGRGPEQRTPVPAAGAQAGVGSSAGAEAEAETGSRAEAGSGTGARAEGNARAGARPGPGARAGRSGRARPPTQGKTPAPAGVGGLGVGGAAAEAAGAEGPTGWSQTVRVNIDKLDRLMNTVGELTLVRNELAELQRELRQTEVDGGYHRRFQREMRTFGRRLDELQRGILEVRMVPLSQTFDKLARVVRRLSRDFEKQITFYVTGGGTEIDKLIVEELSDPLVHIIRNCIDHGVEDPVTRAALGKPAEGMVALRAFPRGNHVVIEVEDDGAGVDPDRLLGSAIERGFLTPETAVELTPREIMNLIFEPGFTTRGEVGPVSGRGVGMDVVKNNLARLSGLIDVFSELGQGTRFTLTLPITLAIIRALIVEVADQRYAIPLSTVLEIFPVRRAQLSTIEGREVVTLRGATLPLLRLEPVFGLQPPVRPAREGAGREYVVVVGMAQHRVGVLVNDLVGQQDIVIKSLGKSLSGVPGIAGATELGGRRTVLVLDIAALVDEFTAG